MKQKHSNMSSMVKQLTQLRVIATIALFFTLGNALAQTRPYPSNYPPAGVLGEWGHTDNGTNWDTSPYLPFMYNRTAVRIMPPNEVTYVNGQWNNPQIGEKYPLFVFLHGLGEAGERYPVEDENLGWLGNNNRQLLHGGQLFRDLVRSGEFNAYLLYPQSYYGFFGGLTGENIAKVIEELIRVADVDPNRVYVNGLSAGGTGTWRMVTDYPKLFAASAPMSAADGSFKDEVDKFVHIPLWLSQGGRDSKPKPSTAENLVNAIRTAGGSIIYRLFPDLGHGTWNATWAEPDFIPFLLNSHKANPLVFFGQSEFCPGDVVSVRMGLTPGFDGYQWRKDGVVIDGANSNEITVTELGTYEARIRRGAIWSPWSPSPVEVKIKEPTITPPITVSGLASKVLPALDGSTSVPIEVPTGYESYNWKKVGSDEIIGTENILVADQTGQYIVTVTEKFGCSSNWSDPFDIIESNGINPPDAAGDVVGFAPSKTQIQLYWTDNPNASFNEEAYEVYRSDLRGSNYQLVGITGQDAVSFLDGDLVPGKEYYYVVRSVNGTSAGPNSEEISVITKIDNSAPTAPLNLMVIGQTATSVTLSWEEATDDVGVYKYEIYKNGDKTLVTNHTNSSATVFGLTKGEVYNFTVKAKDVAGNLSAASNQATAMAFNNGLTYKYYHGSWDRLPDFNSLTPVKVGVTETFNINERTQDDNFGFTFSGNINIPSNGTYRFYLRSDDGSKLYIDGQLVVNYDGLHGAGERSNTISLSSGSHSIRVEFFEKGGGQRLDVSWEGPGFNKQIIPASVLKDEISFPGTAPAFPTQLVAEALSYDAIKLSWADNSDNESGFQIFRSDNATGPFYPVAITDPNVNSYEDNDLEAETTYYYRVMANGQYGESGFSDEVNTGLIYKYYEISGLGSLPDFNNYTPDVTGTSSNFDISPRNRNDDFAFEFEGQINIPEDGQYTFFTSSDDGSQLFINNLLVVNNDGLHGTQERNGSISLNQGTHTIKVTFFERGGGEVLQVRWQGPGIVKQLIPNEVLKDPDINATTLSLPPGPNPPANLLATATSSNEIKITWNDNSDNEDFFEIYRSVNDDENFLLIETLPAQNHADVEYIDSDLFTNVTYYYLVKAGNIGGVVESNQSSTTTLNNAPDLDEISDLSMRFETTFYLNLFARDLDNETLVFSIQNLPAFAEMEDFGDGTALITFNPAQSDVGIYNEITLTVEDQHGGSDREVFNLTVNANYLPEITPIANQILKEGEILNLELNASDINGDDIQLYGVSLPPFVAVEDLGAGLGTIEFVPSYNDQGTYNIRIEAKDANGGISAMIFTVTVQNTKTNQSFYVNFNKNIPAGSPWNNTNITPTAGYVVSDLIDTDEEVSNIDLTLVTPWGPYASGVGSAGMQPGGMGIYPDEVIQTYYFVSDNNEKSVKLSDLDENLTYDFVFFGSRDGDGDRTTNYEINGQSVQLNASNNISETVGIKGINPDTNGEIQINISKASGASYGYLNAMVVNTYFDDGTLPASPVNLSANFSDGYVVLSWKDESYNETAFNIFRSIDGGNSFDMIGTVPSDIESYIDENVIGNLENLYYVEAHNIAGSANSSVVSITTPNTDPELISDSSIDVLPNESSSLAITYSDPDLETVVLSTSILPSFISLTDDGSGNANLTISPRDGDVGEYFITLTATDTHGGETSVDVIINVVFITYTDILINFNAVTPEASPWNNFNALPAAGSQIVDLVDEEGLSTGISVSLLDSWEGANDLGVTTGDNSGVFPDNVMKTAYWESSTSIKQIEVNGLKSGSLYNLIFFGSRDGGGDRTTIYTVNGSSVSQNASYNASSTVQINGMAPINNQLVISIQKASSASYGYLNAMVIQEYENNGIPLAPTSLVAEAISKSDIRLNWVDNSSNESGFEIYRSFDQGSSFDYYQTVPTDQTTFVDNGFNEGTTVFYMVRALSNTDNPSSFTNTASASTYTYSVYVNFNNISTAPAPWNNINSGEFFLNSVMTNLLNDAGNNTGFSIELVDEFEGENPWGVITGDNSGVVPDAVMEGSYWLDPLSQGQLLISNLSFDYGYNFEFFASRDGDGVRNTDYIINGESVTLNASLNSSNTVQLSNIYPDENGEVLINVATSEGSSFGYINGLMIHAFPGINPGLRRSDNSFVLEFENEFKNIQVFPNQFDRYINIQFPEEYLPKEFNIQLSDLSGQILLQTKIDASDLTSNAANLDFNHLNIIDGLYLLSIESNQIGRQVFKIVKSSK